MKGQAAAADRVVIMGDSALKPYGRVKRARHAVPLTSRPTQPCTWRGLEMSSELARGGVASTVMKHAMLNCTVRQMQQSEGENQTEASQCRNQRVCETFNYETKRLASVLFARAIRCFFSSLIEHNHFAQWYLARSAMKAEQPAPNAC